MIIQPVIQSLRKLFELHQELIELAKQKQKAIMTNNIDSLTIILTKEARVIKLIHEADTVRMEAAYAFLREKGIKSQLNLTVTELSKLVFQAEEKKALLEAQQHLNQTLNTLKDINAVNKELTEQSLAFIDYTLNLMVQYPEDGGVYQRPTAQPTPVSSQRLFDTLA